MLLLILYVKIKICSVQLNTKLFHIMLWLSSADTVLLLK